MVSETQGIHYAANTTFQLLEALKSFQNGIAAFAGLDNVISYIGVRDTAVECKSAFKKDAIVMDYRGCNLTVTADKYMDFVCSAKPDLFHTLCDGVTDTASANKRLFNAVDRTMNAFEACARRYEAAPELADALLIGKLTPLEIRHPRNDGINGSRLICLFRGNSQRPLKAATASNIAKRPQHYSMPTRSKTRSAATFSMAST